MAAVGVVSAQAPADWRAYSVINKIINIQAVEVTIETVAIYYFSMISLFKLTGFIMS